MKTPAQKRAQLFRMDVPREDDKNFHRIMSEWWEEAKSTWGSRWRLPVQEMGLLPGKLDDLARAEKQPGRLYYTRHPGLTVPKQANLYMKGNIGEEGEVTVADLELRMRACPLLAAGSITVPTKPVGGHASDYNVYCRTHLNFSICIGFSIHGDKATKKARSSDIGHGLKQI